MKEKINQQDKKRQQVLARQHRFLDKAASIDAKLDEAFEKIDWDRRNEAEKSLSRWMEVYGIGLLLEDKPPERGNQVLAEMQKVLTSHENYCLLMARGSGKTSYVEGAALYSICTGKQNFIAIISANTHAASNILSDIWRVIQEPDTTFSQDYPNICLPFQVCNGSFRRRQLYKGISTEIQKNAQQIVFPRIIDKDGKDIVASGSLITVRGITSSIRGMKKGIMRPTAVILDDLQDSESAENPQQVQKLLNIIRKDIMCLGGKQRLSILQTATPICPQDLVEHIKNDTNWKTTLYPGVIHYPKNMKLWEEYFKIYDKENVEDLPHEESLTFYKNNKQEMDEGAEVFNPTRFKEEDGHISAIQKMLELRHVIGKAAFDAEYQMNPQALSFALNISPKIVNLKTNSFEKLEIPDGYIFVSAASDLNVSYAITTTITAFKPDMTACVIYHKISKCRIDSKLNNTEYNQKIYNKLTEIGKEIKSLNIKIDGWAIDAGGRNWDAVCQFAKNSMNLCGVPACAFAGRASHVFNPYVRSRLRDSIGSTVLCGDQAEHIKSGAGNKYIFFDADLHKELVQKAFLSEVGSAGSCSLFRTEKDEHTEFAIQLCNEKLQHVRHRQDGRNQYTWKTAEPHDFLDCMSMCYAVASQQGISSKNIDSGMKSKFNNDTRKRMMMKKQKNKIKII